MFIYDRITRQSNKAEIFCGKFRCITWFNNLNIEILSLTQDFSISQN